MEVDNPLLFASTRSLTFGPRTIWTNPGSMAPEMEVAAAGKGSPPRIQFSHSAACTPVIFEQLDECCRRFGRRIVVRFFGFRHEEFDLRILSGLPSVRSLYIDVDRARNLEHLDRLEHLQEFGIGVREGDYPQILFYSGIKGVESLVLTANRRNNVDLAPLGSFPNLAYLNLGGHARHIEVLENLNGVRQLSLNQMSKSVRFPWIQGMVGLVDLIILLGSRTDIDEISHGRLERLRVDRVQNLEKIVLSGFPSLTHLHIEDQRRIQSLDLAPLRSHLRWMTVWNCQRLERLLGVEDMCALEFLWISKTRIDPDKVVPTLPACVRQATLAGYGKRRDAAIRTIVESRGLHPAAYTGWGPVT